jgi:hypothetical protein
MGWAANNLLTRELFTQTTLPSNGLRPFWSGYLLL